VLECLTGKRGFGVYFASAKWPALVIGILLLINWLIIKRRSGDVASGENTGSKSTPKIKLTGRAGMIYSDAGRTMKIDSEMLACGEYDLVIYERSMQKWQPPHDDEPITADDVSRIKSDIDKHLQRYRIEWQS
jgi:hypothetical protein